MKKQIKKAGYYGWLILILGSLTGCGSIISRTIPGQGHGNQYYPGVQWAARNTVWRTLTIIDVPFSLIADTLMIPIDLQYGPYQ